MDTVMKWMGRSSRVSHKGFVRGMALSVICATMLLLPSNLLFGTAQASVLDVQYMGGQIETQAQGYNAHVLQSGALKNHMIILGGYREGTYLTAIQALDLAEGTSKGVIGYLHTPRAYYASVDLPDGRILLIGGRTSDASLTGSMEIFDPILGVSTKSNGGLALPSLTVPREYATATYFVDSVGHAKVLVSGGLDTGKRIPPNEVINLDDNTVVLAGTQSNDTVASWSTGNKGGSFLYLDSEADDRDSVAYKVKNTYASLARGFEEIGGMHGAASQEQDGVSLWWLLGAVTPLLAVAGFLVYMLFHNRDMVVFSVSKKQMVQMEQTQDGERFTFVSDLPVTKADTSTDYVAFYILKNEEGHVGNLSVFAEAQEETIGVVGRIVRQRFVLIEDGEKHFFSKEDISPQDMHRYDIEYTFEVVSVGAKHASRFFGKKYVFSKNILAVEPVLGLEQGV